MSAIALYRKYRSQTFEELLGQEHVAETLQAAIREGRVGHAFLFSGSRGTGKTSTARILAKALNCEKGPTPTPCNTCITCRGITDGNSLDVIEIDAASHGGVDDVRELRDNAILAPASARSKIYIVDEAHMVSTQGWNAFLKTVEEPPDHVIFVFATTEPHKVLPTIVSRCQRFDFRRVSSTLIAEHLGKVCAEEGIEADEGALQLIARSAEGGVRDALSMLDQLASGGSITAAEVARLLGTTTGDTMFDFTEALLSSDTAGAVRTVAHLVEDGQDLRVFARSVVDHVRALLFSKQVEDPGDLIDANDETRARLASQAERASVGRLVHLLRLFTDAMGEMRQQAAPRLSVELAVIRATMPEVDDTATAALVRIERLERLLDVGAAVPASPAAEASPAAVREAAPQQPVAPKPAKARAQAKEPDEVLVPEPVVAGVDLDKIRRSWALVLEEVRKASKKLFALGADAQPVAYDSGKLTLEFGMKFHAEQFTESKNAAVISDAFKVVFGAPVTLATTVRAVSNEPDSMDESREAEPAHNAIDVLKSGFGDIIEE